MSGMKRTTKIIITVLCLLAIASGIFFYVNSLIVIEDEPELDNYPYVPNTPAPPLHDGVYVSEHGTMTFNGDGKSVILNIDEELAELTGLPSGETEATYVFLTGYLPPHGYIDTRYDVAHELGIYIDDQEFIIDVGIAAADGSTAGIGLDMVTPDRIPLLFSDESGFYDIKFIRNQ